MKRITKVQQVRELVDRQVDVFVTKDGHEFSDEKSAKEHETLRKKYPKISEYDIEFLENYDYENKELLEALNSNNVILFISHSGDEDPRFEIVVPHLVAVQAVIKVLHRKTLGCNYNEYVRGVIYKKESLCFDDSKKDDGSYYTTGSGHNIKTVIPK
jgi:hypothetical protein